ncbi:XapX domain-containing protein [Streptomyces atroolivaceus]|uniref:XapX domain-containing protein n=1 Tax=Streptomyces atroolivaceus TaxID=66869 RepID=UPI00362FC6AB
MSALGRVGALLRSAVPAFVAGLVMGAVYRALDINSPAPPLIGLTGLAGMVLGERAAAAVRDRFTHRPTPPPSTSG